MTNKGIWVLVYYFKVWLAKEEACQLANRDLAESYKALPKILLSVKG